MTRRLVLAAVVLCVLLFAAQGGWVGMLTASLVYLAGRNRRTPTKEIR